MVPIPAEVLGPAPRLRLRRGAASAPSPACSAGSRLAKTSLAWPCPLAGAAVLPQRGPQSRGVWVAGWPWQGQVAMAQRGGHGAVGWPRRNGSWCQGGARARQDRSGSRARALVRACRGQGWQVAGCGQGRRMAGRMPGGRAGSQALGGAGLAPPRTAPRLALSHRALGLCPQGPVCSVPASAPCPGLARPDRRANAPRLLRDGLRDLAQLGAAEDADPACRQRCRGTPRAPGVMQGYPMSLAGSLCPDPQHRRARPAMPRPPPLCAPVPRALAQPSTVGVACRPQPHRSWLPWPHGSACWPPAAPGPASPVPVSRPRRGTGQERASRGWSLRLALSPALSPARPCRPRRG